MAKRAFDMMMEGMSDAIAYAQGDETRGRVAAPLDVQAIRKATKKSQTAFAEAYRLPVRTVQEWEQHRRQPDAPARVLLSMIEADPVAVEKLIARSMSA